MIDIKELKARLNIEDVAQSYGLEFDVKGWTRCPFAERHNNGDANPSLHLDRKWQRITCHSQKCFGEEGADVIDLVKIMEEVNTGAAVRKLVKRAGMSENGKKRGPQQRIVAEFDYKDEYGNLLYQVIRKEPGDNGESKKFVIRRPDGKGGWTWNAEGVRYVPYHLPDVLASTGPVVIVEGEKHVDALWQMDIPATCNPLGAEKWRDDYSTHLKGRGVIIWPDKDDAGHRHAEQVAQSLCRTGHVESIRVVTPPEELPEKGDILDGLKLGWDKATVQKILDEAQTWEPPQADDKAADLKLWKGEGEDTTESEAPKDEGKEETKKVRESTADHLVKLALQDAILFHDQTQTPYALVNIAGYYETLRCQGRAFRRWLSRKMYETEEKAPSGEALSSALNVIEAKAVFDGERHELHNRVAFHDGAIWYDFTDERWRAVRVAPGGWQIIDNPPILFVRHDHHAPQVEPIRGGDVRRLFDFVAVNGDGPRLLLLTYLVSCFIPDIPHPVPILHGPQGSGKSSTFRVLRRLIDPSAVEILSFPRDNNELVQKLSHHWAALFDNVSTLQGWESDILRRAVTGEGFTKRQLYTDDDDIIYSFRRCCGLNGINVAATRPDLLDRSILIGLDRIPPDRVRTETELQQAFDKERPGIFGGCLDALAEAMRILPEVRLSTLPRMADFARWGCAIAQALGYRQADFLRAYQQNIREQNAEVLEGHPVAAAVLALMDNRETWEGAPSELLTELNRVAEAQKIDTSKPWPKAAHILTRRLNEVRPNLQDVGISIKEDRDATGRKLLIRKEGENSVIGVTSVNPHAKQGLANDAIHDGTDAPQSSVTVASPRSSLSTNGNDATDGSDATFPTPSARDEKLPDWVTEGGQTATVEQDLDRLFETGGEP